MEERILDSYGQWEELLMEAKEAGLTPEEVRKFIRGQEDEEDVHPRSYI
jgi:hypothetical protein